MKLGGADSVSATVIIVAFYLILVFLHFPTDVVLKALIVRFVNDMESNRT